MRFAIEDGGFQEEQLTSARVLKWLLSENARRRQVLR
jgi:hypothetical protein